METSKTADYAPVNGLQMYYEIYGKGEVPLVLLHGGGSTIESTFGTLLPLLSDYGKLIAIELQAHGRTSDRDAPESFEQDADDVAALLVYLKIPKANFLGFSNGGTTSLQIGIRHPQLVNKLVIVSANYKREGMIPGFFENMPKATIDNMPAQLKEAFLKVTPDQSKLQTMFEKDKQRMINFRDINDAAIAAITVPSLLMVADKDVVTVEHVLALSRLLPHGQLVVLPGTHGSFIGELFTGKNSKLPEASAAIMVEFLKR